MLCAIAKSESGNLELYYGRQEFTWIHTEHYHVPERLIDEIRKCPTEKIQSVIKQITLTCDKLL